MANVDYADRATDYVVVMTNANQQYAFTVPEEAKAIEFKAREAVDILHSFTVGAVDTATPPGPYMTLKSGGFYSKDKLYLNATTLYFACASAGDHVEVRVWF